MFVKLPRPVGGYPSPYYSVIVSMSSDLKKGTKTVKVDGKKWLRSKGPSSAAANTAPILLRG